AGGAVTSADLKALFLSWRFPVMLFLGILLVFLYVAIELFSQIHLTGDILRGEQAGILRETRAGFRSLRRFFNPEGALVLLYIFIAVPLCGMGFSIGLTKSFYIPNFIMEVVYKTPVYTAVYAAVILFLLWFGYRSLFTLHAVLLDHMSPEEGRKLSFRIVKENRKTFLLGIVRLALTMFLIYLAAAFLFIALPTVFLTLKGANMPVGFQIDLRQMPEIGEEEVVVILYRTACAAAVLIGTYLFSIVSLLCSSYFMLRFTRWYLAFTGREPDLWPERPKKARYRWKVLTIAAVFVLLSAASVLIGILYNQIFDREEPVRIIAHRAGGTMASENSLEGLYAAIDEGCYASEIDVQRTKDGYYIINHDNDFRRLTGVAKAPRDMTISEIRELEIRDTTGNGKKLPVVTLEEMLDVIRGREVLYIELKGATADRRMVDDVVSIVREHDCVEDVALISLNYDIIRYAETSYPEFTTGTLFFMGIGNVSSLNCDLLIMEEETATESRINQIHDAGKEAIVWTVNTETSMQSFLDSSVDGVITDEILLAKKVQAQLDSRTDLQLLHHRLGSIWF
ncbi:MAG: glycerophosphodiester phosphodiesterase family protein, partial [bacterium]